MNTKKLEIKGQQELNKFTGEVVQPAGKKTGEDFSEIKKQQKKTFTPVRIEDDILEGMKKYVQEESLKSHGVLINHLCRKFLEEKNIL